MESKSTGYKDKHGNLLFVGDNVQDILHMGSIKEDYVDGKIVEDGGEFYVDFDPEGGRENLKDISCLHCKRLDGSFERIEERKEW